MPLGPTDYAFDFNANSGVYQHADGTEPATSDGADVLSWKDTKTGLLFDTYPDHRCNVVSDLYTGQNAIRFDGSASRLQLDGDNAVMQAWQAGAFTLFFCYQQADSGTYGVLLGKASGPGAWRQFHLHYRYAAPTISSSYFTRYNNGPTVTGMDFAYPCPEVYAYRWDGTTQTIWCRGVLVASLAGAPPAADNAVGVPWEIGGAFGALWLAGDVMGMRGYSRALTDAEMLSVSKDYGTALSRNTAVTIYGNSFVAGEGASDAAHAFTALTKAALGLADYECNVNGVNGRTTTTMLVDDASNLAGIKNTSQRWAKYNFCVVNEYNNDLVLNPPTSACYTRIKALCAALKAAGYIVILMNSPNRGPGDVPSTVPTDANDLIAAEVAPTWDILIDQQTLLGVTNGPNYNHVDYVHPNDAGHAILANAVVGAIQAYITAAETPASGIAFDPVFSPVFNPAT